MKKTQEERPQNATYAALQVTPNRLANPLTTDEYRLLRQKQVEEQRDSIEILEQCHMRLNQKIVAQQKEITKRKMNRRESATQSALDWTRKCRLYSSLCVQRDTVQQRIHLLKSITTSTRQIAIPCDIRDGYKPAVSQKKRKIDQVEHAHHEEEQEEQQQHETKKPEKRKAPNKNIIVRERYSCPKCGPLLPGRDFKADGVQMKLHQSECALMCVKCGHLMPFLDSSSSSVQYDGDTDYQKQDVDRLAHFRLQLDDVECRKKVLPQKFVDEFAVQFAAHNELRKKVRRLYRKLHGNDYSEATPEAIHKCKCKIMMGITIDDVRNTVKEIKGDMGIKGYKSVPELWCRMTGRDFPRLTTEERELACSMFSVIQPAFFMKHADTKNFMGYQPAMWHIFRIMGKWHMLFVLKATQKANAKKNVDEPMRKICQEYGWPFETIAETQEKMKQYLLIGLK